MLRFIVLKEPSLYLIVKIFDFLALFILQFDLNDLLFILHNLFLFILLLLIISYEIPIAVF